MTLLPSWDYDILRDLGWTLVDFLWQGLVLAIALHVILSFCRSPVVRHNWALATSAFMALAPVTTFLVLHRQAELAAGIRPDIDIVLRALQPASAPVPWIEWLVVLWLAGVSILSVRAAGGWFLARDLRRRDTAAIPSGLLQRFLGLQRRLAVTQPLEFLQSRHVKAPIVVGWFRPAILIPLSAIAGLSPQQLDAIVAHELAHIRRLDTFINLMLVVIETILFYHPAVWWVTSRVRIEREHCCDDIAVASCGDAAIYVEALTSLQATNFAGVAVLAAAEGKLKHRFARLLGVPSDSTRLSVSAIAGLAFLSLIAVACAATAQSRLQGGNLPFAVGVVDDSVGEDAQQGPPGADRVVTSTPVGVPPDSLWFKREGRIEGDVAVEAHASKGPDGKPIIAFTLTWSANTAQQFAALTRENMGRRLAVVMDGRVISAPLVHLQPGQRASVPAETTQHVTFEATSRVDPSVVVAKLASTSTGPLNYAHVAVGVSLRQFFEGGQFSDLRAAYDPATAAFRVVDP